MDERWHIYAWAEYPKLVVKGVEGDINFIPHTDS